MALFICSSLLVLLILACGFGFGWRCRCSLRSLSGFRNRDLQAVFFPTLAGDEREHRRRSAWVTRRLRLLRAHSLMRKVSGTHRYQLTSAGRRAIAAILAALRSTVRQLTPLTAMAA